MEPALRLSQRFLEALERDGVGFPFKVEVLDRLIQALAKDGKLDEATRLTDSFLKANEDSWQLTQLKAWLLNEKGEPDDAVKTYQRVLEQVNKEDPKELNKARKDAIEDGVRQAIVRIYTKQGKVDEANKAVDSIFDPKEKNWQNGYLKAYVQQETGHAAAAAKIYENVLGQIGNDKSMNDEKKEQAKTDIRYILSGVYVDMDRLDKATEQLKALLAAEPDSPRYNNDLGYILADHNKDLVEAEKMIRKAIDEDRKKRKEKSGLGLDDDKDNAAYLDSLGWVLFKQKKYPEAKKYLLEAIEDPDGQHIEIMDHLGDVYMALGDKANAVATWKKAVLLDLTTLRERQKKTEVEKKIKANQ